MFDKKQAQPPVRAPPGQARKGARGGGDSSPPKGDPPNVSVPPSVPPNDTTPKAVPPSEVMVPYLDQQVSLADLVSMLESGLRSTPVP